MSSIEDIEIEKMNIPHFCCRLGSIVSSCILPGGLLNCGVGIVKLGIERQEVLMDDLRLHWN